MNAPFLPPYAPSVADWVRRASQTINPALSKYSQEVVSAADYGAVGNGTDDCTAAVQKAINDLPNGGKIRFPNTISGGTYRITSELATTADGVSFEGDSRHTTQIIQAALNERILNNSGYYFNLKSMRLGYDGTPVSGATAIKSTGSYSHFSDFTVANAYINMEITSGVAQKIRDFDLFDYELAGLYVHDTNDLFVDSFIWNAGNTSRGLLGGLRLEDKVEALTVTNGDILLGYYSMTMDATLNSVGTRPAYNKFGNVYFDSSEAGVVLDKTVENDFAGCWFSNRPGSGATVGGADGTRFWGGGAVGCGAHGVDIMAQAKRTSFLGFGARGNSQLAANTYSGLHFAAGTTDFGVGFCQLDSQVGFGSQKYGVEVAAGASDRYSIAHNLVSGNGTGGVSDGGTGTNKSVVGNW